MSDPLRALQAATGQAPSDSSADLPAIPAVPRSDDAATTNFLSSVKAWLERAAGSATGFATKRQLADAGVLTPTDNGYGPAKPPNLAIPPVPTGLSIMGAMTNIILDWDDPNAKYGNHAFTEIWASQTSSFSTAVLVGQSAGFNFAHAVGAGSTRYYWIRFVSTSNIAGPYHSTTGMVGQTSNDPAWLLSTLTGQLSTSQLNTALNTRINLIDAAASVPGSVNARIQTVQDLVNDFLIAPDWLAGTTYKLGDMVAYGGKLYRALRTTVGDQPDISTLDWQLIGDYTSLGATVAGHTTDIATLVTDLDAEVAARETLAAGVATKRAIYRQSFAPTVGLVTGDIWIDTSSSYVSDYFFSDYASVRHKMYQWSGTSWQDATDNDLYDNIAALNTEKVVRADADNALSSLITTLTSRVDDAEADIVTEQTARASGDSALATSISALTATVSSNTSAISAEQTARADGDSANATSITAIQARLNTGGDVANAIVLSQTTADTAVTSAATAQTTANSKVKTFFQASSPTASTVGDLWVDTDDNNRIYRWNGSTWQDAHDARITSTASSVTTLQTTVSGHTTSIQTQQTSIDGLLGQYTVKIDNNGYVSGFGLASTPNNGTPYSEFQIVADKFSIAPVATSHSAADGSPFFYLTAPTTINGVSVPAGAYMKSAYIHNASINNAMIANAAIDSAKIADASIVTAKIGDAQISTAKIIDAAISNAKIADAAITNAKIQDATIATAKIADAAITSAKIGDAQITTAKIGDAQVNTLKVAGQSITLTQSSSQNVSVAGSGQSGWFSGFPINSTAIYAQGSSPVAPQCVICFFSVRAYDTDPAVIFSDTNFSFYLKRNGSTVTDSYLAVFPSRYGLLNQGGAYGLWANGFFIDTSPGSNPYYQIYATAPATAPNTGPSTHYATIELRLATLTTLR